MALLISLVVFDCFVLSIINEELECVVGVAHDVCGAVAANHRRDLEVVLMKPGADLYLCEIRMRKFPFSFNFM